MMVSVDRPGRPLELSPDRQFAHRVRRLGLVSLAAPGVIWWLAATRTGAASPLLVALLVGWWLMPAVLLGSIPVPALRPLVIAPATLITLPVLAIVMWWLPGQAMADLGWMLIAAGLLLGGMLGGWLWFRWLPVPVALDPPFAPARWALIGVHVGLICLGLILAATG